MDEAPAVALLLRCPGCEGYLPVNEAGPSAPSSLPRPPPGTPILARYSNEGGVQDKVDILPALTEEAYLQNFPEARPARALLVMCSEGDVAGIVELLRGVAEASADVGSLIRYQDPLAGMKSGLHLAVANKHEETAWLLLWLASALPDEAFPPLTRQAAGATGMARLGAQPGHDIRQLQDAQGRTAQDTARDAPDTWASMLEAGALSA